MVFRFPSTVAKSLLLVFPTPLEGRNDRDYHPHFTEEGKLRVDCPKSVLGPHQCGCVNETQGTGCGRALRSVV